MTTPGTPTRFALRLARAADAARLSELARETFIDTFAADNDPADMAAYVASAFGEAVQRAELADPAVSVFLAEQGDELLGYVMLRDGVSPDGSADPTSLEIARLYAGRRWIGTGVGAALMQRAIAEAAARGRERLWLGVWERNVRALAFYRRWGFEDIGTHPFQLGSDCQTDRVMARHVAAAEVSCDIR